MLQEEETEEEPKDKLHKIAYELLTTERAYVTRLHLLDQVCMTNYEGRLKSVEPKILLVNLQMPA